MPVRGFSVRTHESYWYAVTDLARYFHRSPNPLGIDDLCRYFEYLATECSLSGATCRLFLNGIRFLYLKVLGGSSFDVDIPIPKKAQRIPELLTRAEVGRLLAACGHPKHRMMLTLCYGCGLRLSELVGLKVRDIDGERRRLRVEQGKGAKDRLVPLSDTLLAQLRVYWRLFRPREWLFPGHTLSVPLSETSLQKAFTQAKARAGIQKVGGMHSLRHAYATHPLEAGLPVHGLQRLMGHQEIHSTLRYVHWVPDYREGGGAHDLVAALEVDPGYCLLAAGAARKSRPFPPIPSVDAPPVAGWPACPRLPDRGARRVSAGLRPLRAEPAALFRLPRSPLSALPAPGLRGLVRAATGGRVAGDLPSPGRDLAACTESLGATAPRGDLWAPVRNGVGHALRLRRRPQAP
jgi:integrase